MGHTALLFYHTQIIIVKQFAVIISLRVKKIHYFALCLHIGMRFLFTTLLGKIMDVLANIFSICYNIFIEVETI